MDPSNQPEAGGPGAPERRRLSPSQMIHDAMPFARFAWRRFLGDRLGLVAASLSYTSMLALVPLLAIIFSVLAAFPAFEGARAFVQDYVFKNFVPEAGVAVSGQIDAFLANSGQLTWFGVIGLALTAVLFLNTIEKAFNTIFRVTSPRTLATRLLVSVVFLVLGPVLLGTSFALSSFVFAATTWVDRDLFSGVLGGVTRALPSALIIVALAMIYRIIPNCTVRFFDAVLGAVVAGVLFTLVRTGFGIYMGASTALQTLYGAAAAFPVFLIWIYLTWTVVMLGAEVTAATGEWRERKI